MATLLQATQWSSSRVQIQYASNSLNKIVLETKTGLLTFLCRQQNGRLPNIYNCHNTKLSRSLSVTLIVFLQKYLLYTSNGWSLTIQIHLHIGLEPNSCFMNRRELHSWNEAFLPPLLLLPAPTTSPKLFQMNEGASGTKSAWLLDKKTMSKPEGARSAFHWQQLIFDV